MDHVLGAAKETDERIVSGVALIIFFLLIVYINAEAIIE